MRVKLITAFLDSVNEIPKKGSPLDHMFRMTHFMNVYFIDRNINLVFKKIFCKNFVRVDVLFKKLFIRDTCFFVSGVFLFLKKTFCFKFQHDRTKIRIVDTCKQKGILSTFQSGSWQYSFLAVSVKCNWKIDTMVPGVLQTVVPKQRGPHSRSEISADLPSAILW